jgi:hypothetical protein
MEILIFRIIRDVALLRRRSLVNVEAELYLNSGKHRTEDSSCANALPDTQAASYDIFRWKKQR